jgi:hypothetical protein
MPRLAGSGPAGLNAAVGLLEGEIPGLSLPRVSIIRKNPAKSRKTKPMGAVEPWCDEK